MFFSFAAYVCDYNDLFVICLVPDSVSSKHPQTLEQTVDIFSPAAEGLLSTSHFFLISVIYPDNF